MCLKKALIHRILSNCHIDLSCREPFQTINILDTRATCTPQIFFVSGLCQAFLLHRCSYFSSFQHSLSEKQIPAPSAVFFTFNLHFQIPYLAIHQTVFTSSSRSFSSCALSIYTLIFSSASSASSHSSTWCKVFLSCLLQIHL